eukprot:scaffold45588_cov31-Tisochrysis_lutea.AAC.1
MLGTLRYPMPEETLFMPDRPAAELLAAVSNVGWPFGATLCTSLPVSALKSLLTSSCGVIGMASSAPSPFLRHSILRRCRSARSRSAPLEVPALPRQPPRPAYLPVSLALPPRPRSEPRPLAFVRRPTAGARSCKGALAEACSHVSAATLMLSVVQADRGFLEPFCFICAPKPPLSLSSSSPLNDSSLKPPFSPDAQPSSEASASSPVPHLSATCARARLWRCGSAREAILEGLSAPNSSFPTGVFEWLLAGYRPDGTPEGVISAPRSPGAEEKPDSRSPLHASRTSAGSRGGDIACAWTTLSACSWKGVATTGLACDVELIGWHASYAGIVWSPIGGSDTTLDLSVHQDSGLSGAVRPISVSSVRNKPSACSIASFSRILASRSSSYNDLFCQRKPHRRPGSRHTQPVRSEHVQLSFVVVSFSRTISAGEGSSISCASTAWAGGSFGGGRTSSTAPSCFDAPRDREFIGRNDPENIVRSLGFCSALGFEAGVGLSGSAFFRGWWCGPEGGPTRLGWRGSRGRADAPPRAGPACASSFWRAGGSGGAGRSAARAFLSCLYFVYSAPIS